MGAARAPGRGECGMETLKFDLSQRGGAFKILNATNGGPWHKRHVFDQWRTNMEAYRAARIPYSRNHDSNIAGSIYGGPYAHDISAIFPRFEADADDPASYDFACTDESILTTLDAGTETFFRLGQSIEHQIKKHNTLPPADFEKWASICEHIIRHYNCGWADGYHLGIRYWEIWNEPDLDPDDSANKRTWGGTRQQFFDLYAITAKHLKACFPELKIGGPALAGNECWAAAFLGEMQRRGVPIDFFSWHIYCVEPAQLAAKAERIRRIMDENGYGGAESILNEWNYVKDWQEKYVDSLKVIHGMKGAAFTMACMAVSQRAPLDMLMYYDTRPSVFCGAFDYYTYEPLKGYYPLKWYGMFYDMEAEVVCQSQPENIYTLCGVDAQGRALAVVTYYTDSDAAASRTLSLEFSRPGSCEVYLLDSAHDAELMGETDAPVLTLEPNSCALIRQI